MADFINYNDTIPSPPDGYINVKWQKDAIGNVSAYYLPGSGGSGSDTVDSVFGRIGNVTAQSGDYNVSQITNAVSVIESYSDPDWIISLDWDKLTDVPTTFSPSPHTHDAADVISGIFDPARLGSSALTRSNETQYLRGDSSWKVISYSEISNKPQTFPPSVHTHDSAEIVSGVLAVARLGTGNPSSSNYLRGDGTWATISAGGSQTPWTQNIDAAGYKLNNLNYLHLYAGNIGANVDDRLNYAQFIGFNGNTDLLDFYSIRKTTGTGWSNTAQRIQRVVDASKMGYVEFANWAVNFGVEPNHVMAVNSSNQVYIWPYAKLIMGQSIGERICLWDSGGINHAIGIESYCMWHQVPLTNAVFRWYVGVAPDNGVSAKMELGSNLNIKTAAIINAGYIGLNVEYTDGWRYKSAGAASMMRITGNEFDCWTCGGGAAGATAPINRAFYDNGTNFVLNHPLIVDAGGGRKFIYQGPGTELDLDFYRTDGAADDKWGRVYFSGANIGFERINDAYNTVLTYARLDRFNFYLNVPIQFANTTGLKLNLYPGGGSEYAMGIESGCMWFKAGDVFRWYASATNPDNGGSNQLQLNNQSLISRVPVVSVLPMSQTDPFGFGGNGSASYMYFDPGTKKLAIRYHEQGVAFRTYYLKEGDQGAGTTIYYLAPVSRSLDNTARYITDTFAIPAGFTSVRISANITFVSLQYYVWISFGGTTGTAGNANPTGEPELAQVIYGTFPSGVMTIEANIIRSSDTAVVISGSYRMGSGAWTSFAEQTIAVARGIYSGYLSLSARCSSGPTTLTNVSVTAIAYY